MVDKSRLKVIKTDTVPILKMEDIRKGEKVKEVEKMEKKGNELVEENKKIIAEITKVDEYRIKLANQLAENNGAIKVINSFLKPIKEKNKETIFAEKKKEEKKEVKKESKKGVNSNG